MVLWALSAFLDNGRKLIDVSSETRGGIVCPTCFSICYIGEQRSECLPHLEWIG